MRRTLSVVGIMILISAAGVACKSGVSLTLKGEIANYQDDPSSPYQLNIDEGHAELHLVPGYPVASLRAQIHTFSGIPGYLIFIVNRSHPETEYTTVPIESDGTIDAEIENIEPGTYQLILSSYRMTEKTELGALIIGPGSTVVFRPEFSDYIIGEDDNGTEYDIGSVNLIGIPARNP